MKPTYRPVCCCLLLLLLATAAPPLVAQPNPVSWLADYRGAYLPEKVFVHTDKNLYAGGETIWAAVYLTDGQTHRRDSLSQLIHLELRNAADSVVLSRRVHAGRGHAASELELPAGIPPGAYRLTAYTNFQRNSGAQSLFRRPLRILPGLPESGGVGEATPGRAGATAAAPGAVNGRLRFFPEGGDCVAGLPCRVTCVAEDAAGRPLAAELELRSPAGEPLTTFATDDRGIGTLRYLPGPGGGSSVGVRGSGAAPTRLPDPLPAGATLNVYPGPDTTILRLRASEPGGLGGASLLVHVRGVPVASLPLSGERPAANFRIPHSELFPGVVTVTLFDARYRPTAERLFFVPPPPGGGELAVSARPGPGGDSVRLVAELPGAGAARLSAAVLPRAATGGASGDDIRSWLLLNSDLDRPVPDAPALLFGADSTRRRERTDDYLRTRAWRRFAWAELAAGAAPAHELEGGVYLRGRMTNFENPERARPGKVFLLQMANAYLEEQLTDEEGYFAFGPYDLRDTLDVALQGRFRMGKRNRLSPDISLDDNHYVHLTTRELAAPRLPPPPPAHFPSTAPAAPPPAYAELSRRSLTVARNYDSLIIDLAVVDLVAERIDPVAESRDERARLYGTPDDRLVVDDIPGSYAARSFLDLLRRVPGVQVIGGGFDAQIRIRGQGSLNLSNEPLIIVDGVPTDLEFAVGIQVPNIEFIDVLKGGGTTAMYGSRGANGVILIYLRRGADAVPSEPGLLMAQLRGYHTPRQFATFDPLLPANRGRPDLRTTEHWNPLLRAGADGRTTDTFRASGQPGRYTVIVQGLADDGTPLYGTAEYTVEAP